MKVEFIVFGILLSVVLWFVITELNFIHDEIANILKMNFDMLKVVDERLKKLENKKKKNKEVK